jgi:hypothetical protein
VNVARVGGHDAAAGFGVLVHLSTAPTPIITVSTSTYQKKTSQLLLSPSGSFRFMFAYPLWHQKLSSDFSTPAALIHSLRNAYGFPIMLGARPVHFGVIL